MGIIIRQSIKSTIVVYAGLLLGYINILLLSPLVLSPEQIGLTRVLYDGGYMFAVLAQLGIWSVATKFYSYFRDKKNNDNGFLFYLVSIPLIGFTIVCLLLLIFKQQVTGLFITKSPLIVEYYYYFIPLIFITMYYQVFETYSSLQLRIVVPNMLREVLTKVLYFLIIILLLYHLINFKNFINFYVLTFGISLIILILYLRSMREFHLKPNFKFLKPKLRKQISVYWVFVFFGSLGAFALARMDVIMLSSLSGLYFTGIYSISYLLGNVIEVPRKAIAQISVPIISEAWKNNDVNKIEEIYKKTSINQTIFTGMIFMLIWINIDPIFSLIPNSSIYISGKYVAIYIGIARFIDALTGVNTEILMNSHKHYKFNLILLFLTGMLTIILNLILIPVLNMYGACLSVLIALVIYNLFKYVFIYWKWKIQPFSWNTLKVILLLASIILITYILPQHKNPIFQIIILTIPTVMVFLILCYVLKVSDDYQRLTDNLFIRIKTILRLKR